MTFNREVKISELAPPDSTFGMGRYMIKTIKVVVKSLGPELGRCILNLRGGMQLSKLRWVDSAHFYTQVLGVALQQQSINYPLS